MTRAKFEGKGFRIHDHTSDAEGGALVFGKVLQAGYAQNTGSFSPASTSWEDITSVSVTLTTGANDLYIWGRCRARTLTNSSGVALTHALDTVTNTDMIADSHPNWGSAGQGEYVMLTYMMKISVSAGSHTITLQGADAASGGNQYVATSLMVFEIQT